MTRLDSLDDSANHHLPRCLCSRRAQVMDLWHNSTNNAILASLASRDWHSLNSAKHARSIFRSVGLVCRGTLSQEYVESPTCGSLPRK